MSNTITYETLLNRALQRVDTGVDTSEGSFLFDANAPCVAELYEAYLYIDELEKRVYADTAYGEYLERRCAERGIYRKEATYSIRKCYFDNEVSTNNIPSNELIEKVQTLIDPVQNSGEGLGIAPIGHSVTVEAAEQVEIQLTTYLIFKESS